MLELLDIRFRFICRTTYKNDEEKNPIILRVIYNGDRRDIFTGLYCFKKNWSSSENKGLKTEKDSTSINQNLELIQRRANNTYDELRFSGESFSISQLVEKLKGKGLKPALLVDVLEEGHKQIRKRVGIEITKASFYKYRRSLKYMQEFLLKEYKVKNYTLSRIDVKFLEGMGACYGPWALKLANNELKDQLWGSFGRDKAIKNAENWGYYLVSYWTKIPEGEKVDKFSLPLEFTNLDDKKLKNVTTYKAGRPDAGILDARITEN
jgi:hypothetical protein